MIKEEKWLRETYVDLLIEYGKKDPSIVILEADLMKAAGTFRFAEEYPDRAINLGIQEANMIGVAAGLSTMGLIPFTHTFTPFATRRVCDQVTLSVAYTNSNVKMVGTDPGVTAEYNGGTHMSMEDVAIMRNIPEMVIYEPVDSNQLIKIFPQLLNHNGPVYIRLLRRNATKIFDENEDFTLGKGKIISEGKDVTIFCSGIMVEESLLAAERLSEMGIEAEVINIHTIKPLDENMILHSIKKTKAVVVAENHSVINGLGSGISDLISSNFPTPVIKVGVKDHFGEVGLTDFLKEKYGLTYKEIMEACEKAINMKGEK